MQPQSSQATKRKLQHTRKAEQLGISTRTLDRYIVTGQIAKPAYVNGRKYHDEDSEPRRGPARSAPSSARARARAIEIRKEAS
jgi:predicted site-specific integrase-resolvase